MLLNLTVRNFALVAELNVSLGRGLTVITGESGAGKSILLDALGLVLGERASKNQIRPGAASCEVTAEFDLTGLESCNKLLHDNELLDDSDASYCLVRRVANADGRSRAWINSIPVNLTLLRELCQPLVEIHGQFAQQRLLDTSSQLHWLDDFAGATKLADSVQNEYQEWVNAKSEFETAQKSVQESTDRKDLLTYQVSELDELNLAENEFDECSLLFKRLSNLEETKGTVATIQNELESEISPLLSRVRSLLMQIDDEDSDLKSSREFLETVEINLDEGRDSLQRYGQHLQDQDVPIEEISARLDQIHEVARKHKVHPQELNAQYAELKEELSQLVVGEQDLDALKNKVASTRLAFENTAKQLSNQRRQMSKPFCTEIIHSLKSLGMQDVKFEIDFRLAEHSRGLERIEFLVSPNSKYDVTSLRHTASGGELSRISLAILIVVSKASRLPCLILDEADIGLGGTTAGTVGRMLRRLSEETQVVCVTHAPQVAALGQSHLQVQKSTTQDVEIVELDARNRIEELARMVGGKEVNRDSREYAKILLQEATTDG